MLFLCTVCILFTKSYYAFQVLHLPEGNGDLDTPQPPIPRIVISDEDMTDNGKGTDKNKDLTLSSIIPKKRKKYMTKVN